MQGQCGARPSEWASSPRGLDTLKPGRPSATTAPVAVQCRGRNSSGVAELCRRWEVEGRVAERRQKIEVNKSVESRKGRGQGRRCARQVESGNPRGRATPQQATPIRRRQAGRPHRQTSQDDWCSVEQRGGHLGVAEHYSHSPKLRLVVMMTLVRWWSLLIRWRARPRRRRGTAGSPAR
jgi:hypothetical protein